MPQQCAGSSTVLWDVRDIAMHNATALMREHDKDKARGMWRSGRKKVAGDEVMVMMGEETASGRWDGEHADGTSTVDFAGMLPELAHDEVIPT